MGNVAAAYGRRGNAFGIKDPRFYGPQGHRGYDFYRSRGETIPAYEHGRVVLRGYSSIIGHYIVVRYDSGAYAGWAHTIAESRLPVGAEVWRGTIVALVAGAGDDPGSAWAGSHIHTTLGPSIESIYSGQVWDPIEPIARAIAAELAEERRNMGYLDQDQQAKDDQFRDTWNGVGWRIQFGNWEGQQKTPIEILVGADGNAARALAVANEARDTSREARDVSRQVLDVVQKLKPTGGPSAKEIAAELAKQPEVIAAIRGAFAIDYTQLAKVVNDDAAARMRE